jgi:hypothetical protein
MPFAYLTSHLPLTSLLRLTAQYSASRRVRLQHTALDSSPFHSASHILLSEMQPRPTRTKCTSAPLAFSSPACDVVQTGSAASTPQRTDRYACIPSTATKFRLCVRCGAHAALCMPCVQHEAERSVSLYKEQRALGAAALFNVSRPQKTQCAEAWPGCQRLHYTSDVLLCAHVAMHCMHEQRADDAH